MINFLNMDGMEYMAHQPDQCFDLAIDDPEVSGLFNKIEKWYA